LIAQHNIKSSRQSGFTLIEVLVSFIILAVGLLGIVNLQAMSKKFTHQAAQRTMAVSFADAIVERIRSNPGALLTYTGSATVGGGTIEAEPSPDCTTGTCSSAELASHDLWEWEQAIDGAAIKLGDDSNASGLISPLACFSFTPRAGMARSGFLTVRIQWTGLNSLSDATAGGTVCTGGDVNDDPFRRQVQVNTYVIDEAEL